MTTAEHSEPRTVKVHMKLESSVYEALRERATAGERTIVQEIRLALKQHIAEAVA